MCLSMFKHILSGSDVMFGIVLFVVLFVVSFFKTVPLLMLIGSGLLALTEVALLIIGHYDGRNKK